MINLITGLPGSGKTLYTLKTVKDYVEKENTALAAQGKPPRPVYYHGIPELTIPGWQLMESPEDWINLPSHSIIIIDECQSTFRPRAASVKPPPYIAEFETHRHKGLDFFLMTQHPMLLDGNIRRLAGKHYHVVRFYGFQKSTIHEFQQVRDNVDKNLKNSIQTHFIYPKEVFTWYKSADAHTIKKRIPMRMIMVVVLPFVLAFVGYLAFQAISDLQTKPNEYAKQKNGILPGADNLDAAPQGGSYPEAVKMSYLEARTPALPDFPHTAPIYEELTKPVRAPYPAACISSKSYGCKCFTDKGTKLLVSENVCKQIVENGYYVDWQEQGADTQYQDGGSPPCRQRPASNSSRRFALSDLERAVMLLSRPGGDFCNKFNLKPLKRGFFARRGACAAQRGKSTLTRAFDFACDGAAVLDLYYGHIPNGLQWLIECRPKKITKMDFYVWFS